VDAKKTTTTAATPIEKMTTTSMPGDSVDDEDDYMEDDDKVMCEELPRRCMFYEAFMACCEGSTESGGCPAECQPYQKCCQTRDEFVGSVNEFSGDEPVTHSDLEETCRGTTRRLPTRAHTALVCPGITPCIPVSLSAKRARTLETSRIPSPRRRTP